MRACRGPARRPCGRADRARRRPQHLAGVDRVGVADQRLDLGDRELRPAGPRPAGAAPGAGRAAPRRRARRGARGEREPGARRAPARRRAPPRPRAPRPSSRFSSRSSQREATVGASASRVARVSDHLAARPSPAGSRARRGRPAAPGSAGRRRGACARPSQGSAPGSRGQMPSLSPPRTTRSADCTRASSVPQMAMPGWVTTASSGTSRAAISDCEQRPVLVRRSSAPPASASAAERVEQRPRLRRRPPCPRARAAPPAGPGGQRLGGGAVAGDVLGERRRAGRRSGASVARSQAIQAGARLLAAAQAASPSQSIQGAPPRSRSSSSRAVRRRCGRARAGGAVDQRVLQERRAAPPGSAARRASAASRRSSTPGGVSASGRPALSSGMRPQRSSSAVTRRASVRSGVTSAARAPFSAASRSDERDRERLGARVGRLDPGQPRAVPAPSAAGERARPRCATGR